MPGKTIHLSGSGHLLLLLHFFMSQLGEDYRVHLRCCHFNLDVLPWRTRTSVEVRKDNSGCVKC